MDHPAHLARLAALAVTGLLAAGTAAAAPPMKPVDECMETSTAMFTLPASAVGRSLDLRNCETCDTLRVTLERGTRFLAAGEPISYQQLLKAAAAEVLPVTVCYDRQTRAVTRVQVADLLPK